MEEEEFKQTYGFDMPKRDELLVFYCRVGKRSAVGQYIARKMGYTDVRNYVGSWLDWNSGE
jgi:3-mercaptopyruvate sulfurtransferase SseA